MRPLLLLCQNQRLRRWRPRRRRALFRWRQLVLRQLKTAFLAGSKTCWVALRHLPHRSMKSKKTNVVKKCAVTDGLKAAPANVPIVATAVGVTAVVVAVDAMSAVNHVPKAAQKAVSTDVPKGAPRDALKAGLKTIVQRAVAASVVNAILKGAQTAHVRSARSVRSALQVKRVLRCRVMTTANRVKRASRVTTTANHANPVQKAPARVAAPSARAVNA